MRRTTVLYPQGVCQFCAWLSGPRLYSNSTAIISRQSRRWGNGLLKANRISRSFATNAPRPTASRELPDLAKLSAVVSQSRERFLATEGIPSHDVIIAALKTCQGAANAIQPHFVRFAAAASTSASSSNLLSLDARGSESGAAAQRHPPALLQETINNISESANAIVAEPKVQLTPAILSLYVKIQAKLGRPEPLADAFELYAVKPESRFTSAGVKYVRQNPNSAKRSILPEIAGTALRAAIDARKLDVAIAIIETSYAKTAFQHQRFLRKGLLPTTLVTFAPFVIWGIASQLSLLQNTLDPATATKTAFAGIIAYVSFTGAIGAVALMTSNDHMKRVSWAPGVPLRERWLREEEREALDQVACAWGFKEKWRWGEEGGIEWENLREFIGQRGMILDRVELMEGLN